MPERHRGQTAGQEAGYRLSHCAPDERSGRPLHHYQGGSPDAPVRIYRAAPPGTESVNPGDWITLSPGYARQHGRDGRDPRRDMLVLTAEVPQRDVYWDENDGDELGYQGPTIPHPDVLEENDTVTPWQDYHDTHPHGLEGWLGSSAALPPEAHELAHNEFDYEDDRASALLDAASAQGTLHGTRWDDDRFAARQTAEADAAARMRTVPAGLQVTAFTVHRGDDGAIEDIAVHHYQAGDGPSSRRYRLIDLDGRRYRHPALEQAALRGEDSISGRGSGAGIADAAVKAPRQ